MVLFGCFKADRCGLFRGCYVRLYDRGGWSAYTCPYVRRRCGRIECGIRRCMRSDRTRLRCNCAVLSVCADSFGVCTACCAAWLDRTGAYKMTWLRGSWSDLARRGLGGVLSDHVCRCDLCESMRLVCRDIVVTEAVTVYSAMSCSLLVEGIELFVETVQESV